MKRTHSLAYHNFSQDEIKSIQTQLTAWYNENRRKLPWRGDKPPYGNKSIYIQTNTNINNQISFQPPQKKRKLNNKQKQSQLSSYFSSIKLAKQTKSKKTKISSNSKISENKITNNTQKQQVKINDESILNITGYHIWISEIMLQQTKVETVINYYISWMNKYPTINKLSNSTLEEINSLWAGLGYYRRAKYIYEASTIIIKKFNGKLPSTIKELKQIKGIGDYTANAIASIVYDKCVPAVDGNLVRVISRLRGIACYSSPPAKIHWNLGTKLVQNHNQPGIMNQALMELGAIVCIPKSPKCNKCPLTKYCIAYNEVKYRKSPINVININDNQSNECKLCNDLGIKDIEDLKVMMFPMKKNKTNIKYQIVVSGIIVFKSKYLMIKRPNKGLLALQWEFPNVVIYENKSKKQKKHINMDTNEMCSKLVDRLNLLYFNDKQSNVNNMIDKYEYIGKSQHIFSHIKQETNVFKIYFKLNKELIYNGEYEWYTKDEMKIKPLTMCFKKQWLLDCKYKHKISGRKRKLIEID